MDGAVTAEEITIVREEVREDDESWWSRVSRWSLYAALVLAPLAFWPTMTPAIYLKQLILAALVGIAVLARLGESLVTSRFSYRTTLINPALAIVVVAWILSAAFAPQAFNSIAGFDPTGEQAGSILVFAALYFVLQMALSGAASGAAFSWLGLGGLLLSAFSLAQMLLPQLLPAPLASVASNTIGTVNALSVVLGFYFVVAAGVLASSRLVGQMYTKIMWWLTLVFSFAGLIAINFQMTWIAVGIATMVLLGYQFMRRDEAGRLKINGARFMMLFLILAAAVFFVLFKPNFLTAKNIPIEVSPSFSATLSIAKHALRDHPFLGFGTGRFIDAYNLYLDRSVNQTPFWAVRFNTGAGFLSTLLATTGVIGVLAMIIFLAISAVSVFRQAAQESDTIMYAGSAAVGFVLVVWLFYSSSFTLGVLFFAMLGLLAARSGERADSSRFSFGHRASAFRAPWTVFASSLAMIFIMVASLAYLYFAGQRYTAAVYAASASRAAAGGDEALAIQKLSRSISADPANDQYHRQLANAQLLRVRKIVSEISAGNSSLQQNFQTTVSNAINDAKRATEIDARDPNNWASLGFVYQSIVLFIQGAENLAISSYDEAAKRDPLNPSYPFSKANTYLALADRAAAYFGRANDAGTRQALEKQRAEALEGARKALEESIQLKPDLAESNYLLAQVLIQQGNLPRAIAQVEAVERLAPTDIGVAFQLGVLYYQSGDLSRSEAELRRAIGLNENYSNARYFLGLILDRRGDRAGAIEQFEKIQALNPENQEVKTILANLRAGKPALTTITPHPTERRTPPVKDSTSSATKK